MGGRRGRQTPTGRWTVPFLCLQGGSSPSLKAPTAKAAAHVHTAFPELCLVPAVSLTRVSFCAHSTDEETEALRG